MKGLSFLLYNILSFLLIASSLEGGGKKPYVKLTVFPLNQMAPLRGGARVTFWARLLPANVEEEKYYCPGVRWTIMPDTANQIVAFEESDCPPFEERAEYPRVWKKEYILPQGDWPVRVELLSMDKVLLSDSLTVSLQ